MQYSNNNQFQSFVSSPACSRRSTCCSSSSRYICCSSSSRYAWSSSNSACSSKRSACGSSKGPVSYSNCNNVAGSVVVAAACRSSSVRIQSSSTRKSNRCCCSSEDSSTSRHHIFGRCNKMKEQISSNAISMKSCWSVDNSSCVGSVGNTSAPYFTCSSLMICSHGCSSRSRSDHFKERVAAAGVWGASTCVFLRHRRTNIFEAGSHSAAEKVGHSQQTCVPSANICCRTLVHALVLKQQLQQQLQEEQNVNFLHSGGSVTTCEAVGAAVVDDAVNPSLSAAAAGGEQQQPSLPNEYSAAAAATAAVSAPRAAASRLSQVKATQAAARATSQRGVIFPFFITGDQERLLDHEPLANYAEPQLQRETYVSGGDETPLLAQERLTREPLSTTQEADLRQQHQQIQEERGEEQEENLQQQHSSTLPWMISQQRSPLVGEELLRSIRQLPWARRLMASLNSAAAAANAMPRVLPATEAVEAVVRPAEEAVAGEAATAGRESSKPVPDKGAATAGRARSADAATRRRRSRIVLDATTPAGASAATPICLRTATKMEAAEAGNSAAAEASSAAAEAGNSAAAEAGDSASEVPADTAAAAGGHIYSTPTAAALERATDSAAGWWARQAPRYLGPIIKRISRRPADVQLRLIQLALTYTPLQEEIYPPQRHQLQQQAESMRLHCGGDVVRKKRQQQDMRRMQRPHHDSTIVCSHSKIVSACRQEEARVEEPAAAASSKEDCFSTGEDAADTAAGFETGFVCAGVEHLTEDDVIIFGAPFLWFTQHPRLPLLQRLWCVEQLAFWLHASGRPSALRHLHKPQRQKKQDRQTATQQQHQHMQLQKERHEEKQVQHKPSVLQTAEDNPTTAAGDLGEEDAASLLNEGCFQVSPQGDLQISDIRVWRSIGVAIQFLLREGYLDRAAHMLYSMLSLLYDARAFPAPAPATSSSSSVPQARTCSLSLASRQSEAGAEWTRTTPASRPAAQGTAAVVAAEITGSGGAREMLLSTRGSAGGMRSVPEAASAAATQATPSARVDDLPIASAVDDAGLPSVTGFRAADDTHAPTGGASLRSRASLEVAAGVPAAAVLATAASATERFTGGSVLTAPAISLAADPREAAPSLTIPSTQHFTQERITQVNIIKEGDSSSTQRTQDKGLTEEFKENCGSDSSNGRSKLTSEKMGAPVTACEDSMGRSRTSLFLSPKKPSGGSRSAQHSVKDSNGDSSVALASQAAAESTRACLARHLGLTRWSMSKPVWLKLLARRRSVALAAEDTEAQANVGSPAGDPPPLQQHELEAVTLLESLFFTFHDEVRCAATVMSEALEKQQQAAGRTAGIAAHEKKGGAAGGGTVLLHSVSVCNAASTATSRRLMERFTAARHTGECQMQQYLRRLRVIKIAVHSDAADVNEQQQRLESHDSSWRDRVEHKRKAGERRWVAVLLPTSERSLQATTETSLSQRQTEKSTFFSCAERGTSFSLHFCMTHDTPAGSDSSFPATGGRIAAAIGKHDATAAAAAQPSSIAAETFGLRTLVWYLRLQSHFYKVQSMAMTTFVCRLLTRLLRLCELQRLYPAESRGTESSSGASRLACSTNATSAVVNPLSLFAKRETLPLPFSPAETAVRPPQDGVIVSRVAPSARGATVATPGAVLLAQILEAIKAVHFYDHELLHACCEALRPNVCLLPPQYACGVIFNLGCLGYSDPALASSVAHFLVDSGLLKKDTNVDAMMQLLIGFSRLDFRDDRLTSACIDALMAMPDVLSFTCRPVSLFYLLHSISFHNVRCLPLLVRLLPALQHYAAIVPINVAVLTFHDLVRNSVWPGPYRRLLIPRLLKELSSLAVATLAGATPLCWSLWGHFDVPLLLRLAQQFNTTRSVGISIVNTESLISQPQRNGDLSQSISKTAGRVSGCGVTSDRNSYSDAQSARSFSQCEDQSGSKEGSPRVGDASTTLTLVKASTQFWSAFYCVQLLGLTPRDFLPHAQALDKKYMRGGFKRAKIQRRAKKASSDRNASATVQVIRPQSPTSHSSFASSYSLNEENDVAGKPQFKVASPASVYFSSPHFSSCPSVRFSPWQAGSLAGLKAAQILQTPEANWTPKSSTLHEEVLAACPYEVRAAAINEQPAGPYEVDLVVPPGVLTSALADLAKRRKRP